ncbi:BTB/POZ domain-containing protein 6-like [Oculina patagonica]
MASATDERWQTKRRTVLERNKFMFNNYVMSDIKFAFPDKQSIIPAHKYALAISSPVFFAMFYGDLAEKRESIDITDCDSEVFLQFLRYVYYDDVNFQDVNSAIEVWYLADKYDIPSLAKECVNFIGRTVDPLNAFDVIPHARRFYHQDLENICWEVIDYNAQEIVADDSFLELKQEFLLSMVERLSLCTINATLFKAVDRWAVRRCEEANMTVDGANKRSVLGEDLLKHVRFSLMSPVEFSHLVLPTEILFTTEVIDVFKQFTSVPIPGGLKFSILPRMKNDVPLQSCQMGYVCPPHKEYPRKAAMMSFTVNKTIMICGVKIITEKVQSQPSCRVSLSVALRGEKLRQIKDKYFTNKGNKYYHYGEIYVYFNRPLQLSSETCYTIETNTDATDYEHLFVWSECLGVSSQNSTWSTIKASLVSGCCSGCYSDCIPRNVDYKGEIMELFFKG